MVCKQADAAKYIVQEDPQRILDFKIPGDECRQAPTLNTRAAKAMMEVRKEYSFIKICEMESDLAGEFAAEASSEEKSFAAAKMIQDLMSIVESMSSLELLRIRIHQTSRERS
ncbi:hypothetical protein MMC21_000126 [Puttea exsequens]|nr:hypothetical protein [Puttea exsequens]